MSSPTIPTVHLNGTSKTELLAQYRAMYDAVRSAIHVMVENGPHGRDYYPQGNGAANKAINEHRFRVDALRRVQNEIEAIYSAVYDGDAK